jgi:hypothetical protein
LCLHDRGFQFARLKRYQGLSLADALAFLHQHLLDRAGNLAADFDPERRLDVARGDDRLHQIAAFDLFDDDRRSQDQPRPLPAADAKNDRHRQDEPPMR